MNDYSKLPCTEIVGGHCVIINDVECPEARMVSVIISVDGDSVLAKYLNAHKMFNSWSDGVFGPRRTVTPIADFGADVLYDPETNQYWCEQTRDSKATYSDGQIRPWQERTSCRYTARGNVVGIAKQVAKETQ